MFAHLRSQRHREQGFTMVELLVTIIIIGVLAAVAVPLFLNQRKTAVDTSTRADIKNAADQIENGLTAYRTTQCVNHAINTTTQRLTIRFYPSYTSATACSGTMLGSVVIPISQGTNMTITGQPHTSVGYTINAWNTGGTFNANSTGKRLSFNSQKGGFQ